jgi:NAD-dependent SIR2 family protein deacetylase
MKIDLLANLILQSKECIAYTGAGISTSSGIADYASVSAGAQSQVASLVKEKTAAVSWLDMKPSLAHYCLTELYYRGLLKWWCQQNHDGLPQKAGMPQVAMNEIHGSWWDPSNPVVKMSGNLRGDLFDELLSWEKRCDLCITVGTSLSGMNADRLAESCGQRALKKLKRRRKQQVSDPAEYIGGTVIIGFQRTRLDPVASLRIFSSIDNVMKALAERLQLNIEGRITQANVVRTAAGDVFTLPGYDQATGELLDSMAPIVLNMTPGSRVRLLDGPYKGALGEVMTRTKRGDYKILFQLPVPQAKATAQDTQSSSALSSAPKRMVTAPQNLMLGRWMIEGAMNRELKQLPIVNE